MIRGPCFTCHHVITPHNAVPCKKGAAGNCRLAITDSICNVTLTILYLLPLLPETTLWLITAAAAAALYRPGMVAHGWLSRLCQQRPTNPPTCCTLGLAPSHELPDTSRGTSESANPCHIDRVTQAGAHVDGPNSPSAGARQGWIFHLREVSSVLSGRAQLQGWEPHRYFL